MIINPDAWAIETCNTKAKDKQRQKIKQDVEAYLAQGKKIKKIPLLKNTIAKHKKQILKNMDNSIDHYGKTIRNFNGDE